MGFMRGDKDSFFKSVFLVAAIYDFVLGFGFLFLYKPIYSYFNIAMPVYPMYLQLASAFVIAMGVGYYFVYRNLYRNIDLVKLGIVYKFVYSGFAIYFFMLGAAHILFLWFGVFDVIFLVLFFYFLSYAKKDRRFVKWK